MGRPTAVKHPMPDLVKPSFVIFDIQALWRSGLSVRVSGCQKLDITRYCIVFCVVFQIFAHIILTHFRQTLLLSKLHWTLGPCKLLSTIPERQHLSARRDSFDTTLMTRRVGKLLLVFFMPCWKLLTHYVLKSSVCLSVRLSETILTVFAFALGLKRDISRPITSKHHGFKCLSWLYASHI